MSKTFKLNLWYVVAVVIAIVGAQMLREASQIEEISYTRFDQLVAERMIAKIVVTDRHILGHYKTPQDGKT